MKKKFDDTVGPVALALDIIGERWSLLIIQNALHGVCRFNEFERNLGLARNILSSRLRMLVGYGILERHPASDGSMYSKYVLTYKGLKISPIIDALSNWGEEFIFSFSK